MTWNGQTSPSSTTGATTLKATGSWGWRPSSQRAPGGHQDTDADRVLPDSSQARAPTEPLLNTTNTMSAVATKRRDDERMDGPPGRHGGGVCTLRYTEAPPLPGCRQRRRVPPAPLVV